MTPLEEQRDAGLLDAFANHLAIQRGLSEHTVRAYCGDLLTLLALLPHGPDGTEPVDLGALTLPALRRWLAQESGRGLARRSEEHTSELQSRGHLVCRLLLVKKKF